MKLKKKYVLWRWDKPSSHFEPYESRFWPNGVRFSSHNNIIYAGLTPTNWLWLGDSRGSSLHKIVLNESQARRCMVAEGSFRPSEEEILNFVEKRGIRLIGSMDVYRSEKYEGTFKPLPDYKGGYNCAEVLIPFPVETKRMRLLTFYYKIKARIFPNKLLWPAR